MTRNATLMALALWLLAGAAAAEQVVAGLSQDRVSITTNFSGSEILVYGAVRRTAPLPDGALGVVVTVAGPDAPVTVRRKSRVAGIWVNTDAVEIALAPSFYAVATTEPLEDILSDIEDTRLRVSIPRAIRAVAAPVETPDIWRFLDALIRIRRDAGLYQVDTGTVDMTAETLFETRIALPATLTEGDYRVRIYLTRDRRVIDAYTTRIFVQKVGLERILYLLAHERPAVYGLLSIAIAIAAGWGASAAFRWARS